MKKLLCIVLVVVFTACSDMPGNVIPPAKMQLVVYDIIQADDFINNFLLKDSTLNIRKQRSILYERVFKLHGTTRADFYASFKYYQQHPDLQKTMFDSLYVMANRKIRLPSQSAKPGRIKKITKMEP